MVQTKITPTYFLDGNINLQAWLEHAADHYSDKEFAPIKQAAILSQLTGEDQATPYGNSCLQQSLSIAEVLTDLQVDAETLAAALVYTNAAYADLKYDVIEEQLGKNIAQLVKGIKRMEAIHEFEVSLEHHEHHPKLDNIRKMLLAMVSDVRVVLIKLAERLCILRNVAIFDDKEKVRVAKETMAIYAPLANRLGVSSIKWQLEDLAFSYLMPDDYKTISKALNEKRIDREAFVIQMIDDLAAMAKDAGIKHADISGRAKHIYSIHRKMKRKGVDFSEIYDAIALRVIVPDIENCYSLLSSVQDRWTQIPKEFDDYIATPKPNGYRSIHTAVDVDETKRVEIQIRTQQMHDEAELGGAAHWVYKEGAAPKTTSYHDKIAWLRQVMAWQKEVSETSDDIDYNQLFDDRVYVFTPNGDVIDMPKGATVLDFAYYIHSDVGNTCKGAKVNGKIVPLTYQVSTGEQIAVLTAKQNNPSRDWINPHSGYLHTSRAKAKVHSWFNAQDHEQHLALGHSLLEKELKRLNIKNADHLQLAKDLKFKSTNDFMAALGRGDLRINAVLQVLQATSVPEAKQTVATKKSPQLPSDIEVQGVGKLLTHTANCCKPVPGDTIVGYVTRTRGVTIHRNDCGNIDYARQRNAERLIEVNWGTKQQTAYPVDLQITAYDKQGLIKDISQLITNYNNPLLGLNYQTNANDDTATISATIQIASLDALGQLVTRLAQLPNVIEVRRSN